VHPADIADTVKDKSFFSLSSLARVRVEYAQREPPIVVAQDLELARIGSYLQISYRIAGLSPWLADFSMASKVGRYWKWVSCCMCHMLFPFP